MAAESHLYKRAPLAVHITLASRSGAALYVAELVGGQAKGGMPVIALVPEDFDYLDVLLTENVLVKTIPGEASPDPTLLQTLRRVIKSTLYVLRFIRGMTKESRLVTLHFNFLTPGFFQLLATLQARCLRLRSVMTMHDTLPHYTKTAPVRSALEVASHWLAFRLTDRIHVHTTTQADSLRAVYGVPPSRIVVIPHGVTVPEEDRGGYQRGKVITFGILGSLRRNKNIRACIEAFIDVAKTGTDVRLLIAGKATRLDRAYWQDCKALIDASGAPIEVVDRYLSEKEFAACLSRLDCIVLPYSAFLSQSGVVLRAASYGVPVISSAEVVVNDINLSGFCPELQIANVTAEEIARAMLSFLTMPTLHRRAIGDALKELCRVEFTWEKVAPRFVNVYRAIAN